MTTRILLVGAGGFGAVHAGQIAVAAGCELIGVCDPDPAVAVPRGVPVWRSLDAALDDVEVDLVAVCTPTATHVELVTQVMERGLAVLLEKPVARDLGSATALAERVRASNAWVDVVSQRRFQASSQLLKQIVAAGDLGEIASVNCVTAAWREPSYFDSPWHGQRLLGGGNLLNHGMHAVDLLVWLFGMPSDVVGLQTPSRHAASDIDETCVGVMRFPGGTLGVVEATLVAKPYVFRLEVRGSGGTAVLSDRDLRLSLPDGASRVTAAGDTDQALSEQYAAVARRLRAAEGPTVGIDEAVAALTLAMALSS